MFEFEVNHTHESLDQIPPEVMAEFEHQPFEIQSASLLSWEEHCTECAMPDCYRSCDLYVARKDGHCRRFSGGMSPIRPVRNLQGYVVRIDFKAWGELVANSQAVLVRAEVIRRMERSSLFLDEVIAHLPDGKISVFGRRGPMSRLRKRAKRKCVRRIEGRWRQGSAPDVFMVEVYNPNKEVIKLSLSIRNPRRGEFPYQQLIEIEPGFRRVRIPYSDIEEIIGRAEDWHVVMNPNLAEKSSQTCLLYFGLIGFVGYTPRRSSVVSESFSQGEKPPVKVVVWDLDNTLWDGILVEYGKEGIRLNEQAMETVRVFDERGIVNTIVSKNSPQDAADALATLGIEKYFVFPQYGWEPKPTYFRELIAQFNVSSQTFAFVDDSEFERALIQAEFPEIRVYDASEIPNILDYPEFKPPLSSESKDRRSYYQAQVERKKAHQTFDGRFVDFLRQSEIEITILTDLDDKIDRINELVQRTNQLNFSGNRYTCNEIQTRIHCEDDDCFAVRCKDKFGEYGIVGFCIVERPGRCVTDLMFSCRVQGKRIEHAFLLALLNHYRREFPGGEFTALYKRTERNKAAVRVFEDIGFTLKRENPPQMLYSFDLKCEPLSDEVIDVIIPKSMQPPAEGLRGDGYSAG